MFGIDDDLFDVGVSLAMLIRKNIISDDQVIKTHLMVLLHCGWRFRNTCTSVADLALICFVTQQTG